MHLAVLASDAAIGCEQRGGVVYCIAIALEHAQEQMDAIIACNVGKRLGLNTRHGHGQVQRAALNPVLQCDLGQSDQVGIFAFTGRAAQRRVQIDIVLNGRKPPVAVLAPAGCNADFHRRGRFGLPMHAHVGQLPLGRALDGPSERIAHGQVVGPFGRGEAARELHGVAVPFGQEIIPRHDVISPPIVPRPGAPIRLATQHIARVVHVLKLGAGDDFMHFAGLNARVHDLPPADAGARAIRGNRQRVIAAFCQWRGGWMRRPGFDGFELQIGHGVSPFVFLDFPFVVISAI